MMRNHQKGIFPREVMIYKWIGCSSDKYIFIVTEFKIIFSQNTTSLAGSRGTHNECYFSYVRQTARDKHLKPLASFFILRAVNGTRTHDPQLGKLVLYQLSYYRV